METTRVLSAVVYLCGIITIICNDAYLVDLVHFSGDEGPFLVDGLPVGRVLHVLEVETV